MRTPTLTTVLASACFLASVAPTPALGALKHPDSFVFQQLADLTRPHNEKHHPDKPFGSVEASSKDLSYKAQGVDWKVTKTQAGEAAAFDANGFSNKQQQQQEDGSSSAHAFGLEPIFAGGKTIKEYQHEHKGKLSSWRASVLQTFSEFKDSFKSTTSTSSTKTRQRSAAVQSRASKASEAGGKAKGSTFSPMKPPSLPLAVRSPYLNDWAPAGQFLSATPPNHVGDGGNLAGMDTSFWTSQYGASGDYRLGWHGFIRVDNVTYQWMGDAFGNTVAKGPDAEQVSVEYTATKTIYKFTAAGVGFTVTFLTPIWPDDLVRQSIPMSYLHFELDDSTVGDHSVQLFVDIDEKWVTAHVYDYDNYKYNMNFKDLKGVQRWYIQRNEPQVYTEYHQRAEWGNVTWAARDRPALYARNNNDVVVQYEFLNTGMLTQDRAGVGGPDNSFAYAVDFDSKQGGSEALFAIGHLREPYINYIRAVPGSSPLKSYQQDRYGLWQANFSSFDEVVTFFLDDYENAFKQSTALDEKVVADSKAVVGGGAVGDQYAAITQLSLRQSLATIEFTISKTKSGDWNTSDTLVFLKEISSNGDMSTVDVIFPQFPLLTYLNPEILKLLMLPIFEYTESGLYPNKWCVHDLGVYPNGFGHNDGNDEPMQVEESGNMILMTLHWAQLVGKEKAVPFLKKHYRIMSQWAEFLIQDSLIPASQLSTDDFAGVLANQTNLAIKGIEGIAAMGKIAEMIGQTSNASYYEKTSTAYIQKWQGYALSKDKSHTKLAYQDDQSWGTLYNLFGDRLLNLELVPRSIYDIQDKWYPRVAEEWGVPLDSRHNWTKSDWEMFASATSASSSTRDLFIQKLYSFYSNGRTDAPATDLYESTTGDFPKLPFDPLIYFLARPVVGGHFMHLAMAKADKANGISKSNPYKYGPEGGATATKSAGATAADKDKDEEPAHATQSRDLSHTTKHHNRPHLSSSQLSHAHGQSHTAKTKEEQEQMLAAGKNQAAFMAPNHAMSTGSASKLDKVFKAGRGGGVPQ